MNYLLWNLFGPANWPIWLLLIAAAALLFGERGTGLAKASILAAALAVLTMGILPTGFWLMRALEAAYPTPSPLPSVDHIVVLAGGEKLGAAALSDHIEFDCCAERVLEGTALAHRYPRADLWAVGGYRELPGGPRDIDWMADYWRRAGITPSRLHVIGDTLDTCANALGIARKVPRGRILLVTSGFHLPRAMACLKAAGRTAIPYAADRQTWKLRGPLDAFHADLAKNLERTDLALHEYVGIAYYRLRGRIG